MITKLTKKQENQIPKHIEKWVGMASKPMDKRRAVKAVEDMYVDMGEDKPIVIIGKSPLHTALLCYLFKITGGSEKKQLPSQLRSTTKDWYFSMWWLVWAGWYDYAKYIGVAFDMKKYDLFMRFVSEVSFIIPYKGIAFISEKPSQIHWKDRQLHKDGGMAVKYSDGYGMYCLNGVRVPEWLAETPAMEIDPKKVVEESNVEVRREILRKIGIERFVQKMGAETLDKKGNYELLDIEPAFNDGVSRLYLKMRNPSISTWHVEGVGSECKTVAEALHWRKPDKMRKIPVSDNGKDWYQQGDVCIWPREAKFLKPLPKTLT